ncbi:WcaI family glycosyltransferase [Segetibacter koreensis]|uniref:WcaI family glycosyltransferase n=1 Tax=Segetibacter koreensis TaxID=398037 RepID=UPI000371BD12|nr:WcaI family glycosyltransferase [Segetibacter koreensis]
MLRKKNRILLIGGNYFPEPTGIGKYSGEMMKWLAEQGNDCTVITTFPYYPHWKVQKPYEKRCFWYKAEKISVMNEFSINIIRCPHYVPKEPTGIRRVISEFSFFFSSYPAILLLLFRKKFDYVITVAPPFELGLLGILYKKVRGGKFLYHIQDLQIDAARNLKMIKSNRIVKIFLAIEKYIIKHADFVSTISKGMVQKVKNKCNKDVFLFPNWVDIETFYPLRNRADLKHHFGFNSTDIVILYSGAIGHKQGLEAILYSAKALKSLSNVKFAICGCGPYKDHLTRLKNEMNLTNLLFLPLQPLNMFNLLLNMADLHLVLQKAEASDLVLPSKLSTILSVGGIAIVTANNDTSLHEIMSSNNMGILIEPENLQSLVEAIKNNISNCNLEEKRKKARLYVEKHLERDKILNNYFSKVLNNEKADFKLVVKKVISTAKLD